MFNIRTIELAIGVVTIAMAYAIAVTIAGSFQAWVAKKMGDNTPALLGYMSLNPLVHVDIIGTFCFFFLGIGWGRLMPIGATHSRGAIRLLLICLGQSFGYLLVALLALLVLLTMFGIDVLNVTMAMVLTESVSLGVLTKLYPATSSFILAIALILVMLVYIGVLFGVLDFILGGFRFAILTWFSQLQQTPEGEMFIFLMPLVLMIFFSRPLRLLAVYGISYVAYGMAMLVGAV